MRLSTQSLLRAVVLGLLVACVVPAIAFGQAATGQSTDPAAAGPAAQTGTQSGTTGNGNGSQSGSVSNNQSNSQHANGNSGNVQQNQTNQNCVAGRDCVNNNVTNQNQTINSAPAAAPARHRVFEAAPVHARATVVRHVPLAFTGFDLRILFLIGALVAGGGAAVLVTVRRRWVSG